jgi:hypothetical protein
MNNIKIKNLNYDKPFVNVDIGSGEETEIQNKVEIEESSENTSNLPGFQSRPSKERFLESLNRSSPFIDHSIEQQLSDTPVSEWKTSFSQLMISFDSIASMRDFKPFNRVKKLANIPICLVNSSYDSIAMIKNVNGVTGVYADSTNKIVSETWSSQSTAETRTHYETFLQNVKLDTLHSLGLTGSGVTIAILDTGIDANHPDLDDLDGNPATNDPKVLLEKSFIDYDGDGIADTSPLDHMGHGTHVAGIAAANGILTGAAPDAWLLNGKVLDNNGYGSTSWLINGIDWAITNGANIISLSLTVGDSTVLPILETAIQYAWENNVLVVAAAGNYGPFQNSVSSLGSTTRTLTVGASGPFNSITSFSSRGPSIFGEIKPNVVAPGESVFSTVTGFYMQKSGTSMATSIVSGLAAVLLSSNSSIGVDSIRTSIISTATNLDYHTFSQGAGLVNAEQAYFFLQYPSISAFPVFPESSKLTLSPREHFEYQFDVYLNGSYTSVSVEPSPQLTDFVNISPLDTNTESWLRFKITINMSDGPINGDLIVKNGSIEYLLVPLFLATSPSENDAYSNTDAGETLNGAIGVQLAYDINGTFKFSDTLDIFTIDLVRGYNYSLQLKTIDYYIDACSDGPWCSYGDDIHAAFLNLNGDNLSVTSNKWDWENDIRTYIFTAQVSGVFYIGINYPYPVIDKSVKYWFRIESNGPAIDSIPSSFLTGEVRDQSTGSELQFIVEVNVTQSGSFRFWYSVSQHRVDYEPYFFHVFDSSLSIDLGVGIHDIYLGVPGGILSSSKYNGSYILNDLFFYEYETGNGEEKIKVYSTKYYLCTDFISLDNRLISYSFTDVDIDSIGQPEILRLTLNFYFNDIGNHWIAIVLQDNRMFEFVKYKRIDFQIETKGLFSITYDIFVQKFFARGDMFFSGFFASWLQDEGISSGISIYHKYSAELLKSYSPILSWEIFDTVFDDDFNGQIDSVKINVQLESKVQDKLHVYYSTYSLSNGTFSYLSSHTWDLWNGELTYDFDIGISELDFEMDMKLAHAHGIVGPFLVIFQFTLFEGEDYIRYDQPSDFNSFYVTDDYADQEFESPVLTISNYEVINVLDFYGGIQVNLEINSSQDLDVKFRASMEEGFHFNYWSIHRYHQNLEISLQKGINSLSFMFNLEDLIKGAFIGDLILSSLQISSIDNSIKYDYLSNYAIIRNHDYREYLEYIEAYILSHSIIPKDNDSDGLYDEVIIKIDLRVNIIGTYYTNYTFRNYGNGEEIIVESKGTPTGNQTVNITIDIAYYFRESYHTITFYSLTSSVKEYFPLDFDFDINDFNYNFPLQVLAISDTPQDLNSDGLYDLIRFDVELDVSMPGDYIFDTRCMLVDLIEDWLDERLFLNMENVVDNSLYLTSGVQVFSFILDSIWLLDALYHLGGDPSRQSFYLQYLFTIIDGLGPFDLIIESNSRPYNLKHFNLNVPIVVDSVVTEMTLETSTIFQDSTVIFRIVEDIWPSVNLRVYYDEWLIIEGSEYYSYPYIEKKFPGPFSKGTINSTFTLNLTEISENRILDVWESKTEFDIRFEIRLDLVQPGTSGYLALYSMNIEYFDLIQTFIGNDLLSETPPTPTTTTTTTARRGPGFELELLVLSLTFLWFFSRKRGANNP